MVLPLVEESLAFPPVVPRMIGKLCAASFGVCETKVTAADADFVASACNTTLTVTFAGFGTCAGAVYAPKALIVPVDAVPPTTPFTSQLTAVFVVPVTVSLNGVIRFTVTRVDVGSIVTAICCPPPLPPPQETRNKMLVRPTMKEIARRIGDLIFRAGIITLQQSIWTGRVVPILDLKV